METIAGGASLAPNLKSFPGPEEANLISSGYSSTAFMKAQTNKRNLTLSEASFPGSNN